MAADFPAIPADALLQHRGFVQALARSLTRDEHAAEDLAQETWLEALKRPPRSAEALRGWLARVTTSRARNAARSEGRRAARERSAARVELDDSEETTRERVRLQHRVVEAVLALAEPYRTVVLLRYDQGLEPAEIAARRGVPAGTIRSQLSRAHAMLRQRLDDEFQGSRAAWLVPLAALGTPRTATIAGGKLVVAAACIVVVAGTYVAIVAESEDVPANEVASLVAPARAAGEPDPTTALDASMPESSSRSAVEQRGRKPDPNSLSRTDLEALAIPELLVHGRQVQRELRRRLLEPDLAAPATAALLRRVPDAQVARLLPYGRIEGDIDGRMLGIRGAGACWSFATKSNDYDWQPDVMLSGEMFDVLMYGGTAGWIHDLGRVDLSRVVAEPGSPPLGDTLTRDVWSLFWEDARIAGREFDRSLEERARTLELATRLPAAVGHTYLIRKIMPGEHDVLAAFTALDRDEYGYTIAGRVLHSWPLPESAAMQHSARFTEATVHESPGWMRTLDVPALLELSSRIREVGSAKLFAVPEDLARRFPDPAGRGDRGFARMLHRFGYDAITVEREAGAFFTFPTRSSAFDGSDDLRFEQGRLSVSGSGAIADLGQLDFGLVEDTGSVRQPRLSAELRKACDALENARHASAPEDLEARRTFEREDEEQIQALDPPLPAYGIPAVVGNTSLLRSVVHGKHDVLVAFAVVDSDEHGIWIRWRILKSWPM